MIGPFVLVGQVVRLEPLLPGHAAELAVASAEDRSSYGYTRVPDGLPGAERYVESPLADQAAGRALPWAVRRHSNQRVVGSTRFLDMEVLTWPPPGHPESGEDRSRPMTSRPPSWKAAAPGTHGLRSAPVSTARSSGCSSCTPSTSGESYVSPSRPTRATAPPAKRSSGSGHKPKASDAHTLASDGSSRDSAYYSIVQAEWPATKSNFQMRIGRSACSPSR